MKPENFLIIGLTGSIGMGKSTVARMFEKEGFFVFNADDAIHRVTSAKGKALPLLRKKFPEAFLTGLLDRKKLANLVFENAQKRKDLEKILHPFVWQERDRALKDALKSKKKGLVLDIPLLFETGADTACDVTICVSASPKKQRARVLRRRGMTLKRLEKIGEVQMPDAEKRKKADYVVQTEGTLAQTRAQVFQVLAKIL